MKDLIIFAIIILYIIGNAIYDYIKNRRYEQISIRESLNLTGNPIIMLENNGKILNFVVDTGANKSMIDSTVLQECNYKKLNKKTNNIGIEGKAEALNNIQMNLKGRKSEYVEEFNVTDLSTVVEHIKNNTGVTIHGLIGTPFLTKYNYVLDFEELVIYSKKK